MSSNGLSTPSGRPGGNVAGSDQTPITDGEQLFMSLRKRGIPAEFVRYPRSFHSLSRTGPPWLLVDRLERIRTWFAYWIGTGQASPAAATSQH